MSARSVDWLTFVVALLAEGLLELGHVVEVVLECVLVAAGDHQDVGEPRIDRLLDHVLDGRLVDDGEHLLRHRLGRGEESCSQPCRRDHCFRNLEAHGVNLSDRLT
jgi:hypothetical protein